MIKRINKYWQGLTKRKRTLVKWTTGILVLACLLNVAFPPKTTIAYSAMLYDANGELLHARLTPDEKWRLPLQEADITATMEKAMLAKEDRWFYFHPGVNPFAVFRALGRNISRGKTTSGASTITMQLARLLEPRRRNLGSKCIEMLRALQLELRFSKKEILRMYLNLAPYGGNIEGIASASYFYLDKSPDHLSLAEITALSIIPNRPNSLTPGKHNAAIISERNRWLHWFVEHDFFTEKAVATALAEPFTATRLPAPRLAPHLATQLRFAPSAITHSTLLLNTQLQAEKVLADYINTLKNFNIKNGAAIIVDNSTRKVLAVVGSANFFDTTDAGQVNGTKAVRQPGSTLKPLVYGLAMDAGLVTPRQVIADVPVNYQGYVPENYDQRFNGLVPMEYALMHSLNIPAVNTLQQLGTTRFIHALALCKFNQIVKDEQKLGLSMILGGCGATLEELTGMYCMIANNGTYLPLQYTNAPRNEPPVRVISEEAAFMLHETLSKIDRPDLPINWSSTESLPRIAWKTGTSYGRRDAWSIGYNKQYTIGVWVGNFSGQGIPELSGATIATPLLFKLFNAIDRQSHTDWYELPTSLEQRMVCAETGMPPAHYCDQLVLDYFIPLISPTAICNNRSEIPVSADGKISYCAACIPNSGYQKKWYRMAPPEIEAFHIANRPGEATVPPHNPACEKIFGDKGPLIKSPKHQAVYYISKQHPEPLALECQPEGDVAMVHWYLNDQHYKSAPAREKVFFMPVAGRQKISCTDDKGRNRNVFIDVEWVNL